MQATVSQPRVERSASVIPMVNPSAADLSTNAPDATCGTIRLTLLKIGALVRISVRRVKFSMASAFPYTDVFRTAWAALDRAAH